MPAPGDSAKSWLDVLDALYAGSWSYDLERFRSPFAFRGHSRLGRIAIVSARSKWEIRDKLDQANINERVLFPVTRGQRRERRGHAVRTRG